MYRNHIYRDINQALPSLFGAVLRDGSATGSRNGDVRELTHVGVTLTRPLNREILIPERKANLAAQIAETMWVLSGRDDIEFLSHYLPRAAQFSDDQKVWRGGYGKRLRAWPWPARDGMDAEAPFDQVGFVVNLLKDDPLTRRAIITIYDPVVDSADGLDIPCNNWLHFLQRDGSLDLHVTIRSNDLMWGWSGINQFEWSALLEVVARLAGFDVGALHFSISSLHVYKPHWEKAKKLSEQKDTGMWSSPRFQIASLEKFDNVANQWFAIEAGVRRGSERSISQIDLIPDPMLRAWMRVIHWWWSGDEKALASLAGTSFGLATMAALQPPIRKLEPVEPTPDGVVVPVVPGAFVDFVVNLHAEKNAAYGDSWKRRGEMLGIMANIARKIDRLGVAGAGDTAADTAIDLLVYLVKYRLWLVEFAGEPILFGEALTDVEGLTDEPEYVANHLREIGNLFLLSKANPYLAGIGDRINYLKAAFEDLEVAVTKHPEGRTALVNSMLGDAWVLAETLWVGEQGA